MTVELISGARTLSLSRDEEGNREYRITRLVRCTAGTGPAAVLQTPGLYLPGAYWDVDGDVDIWAFCTSKADVTIHDEKEGDKPTIYKVAQTFSTKGRKRCNETNIEDPLLEPPEIGGGSSKFQEEATFDRTGYPIRTSSHEVIRGPQVEFDKNRPKVRIKLNVPTIAYVSLAYAMQDAVNIDTLWGYAVRCVKLSEVDWNRKYYGQCYVYYELSLGFDIRLDTFDRDLLDEGSKMLNGHWDKTTGAYTLDNVGGSAPDPYNPQHFIRAKDRNGENTRFLLNGAGIPAETTLAIGSSTLSTDPGTLHVEKYDEANFLLLGIPATL